MTRIAIIFLTVAGILKLDGLEINSTSTTQIPKPVGATTTSISQTQQIMDSNSNSLVADRCNAFTYGLSETEFTSPLYPADYPPGLECIKLITAEVGYVAQIQFIDQFQIENREDGSCKYDYLEVRDGQFAASPLKDRLCGGTAPFPYLQSSGRWLWLRFHSDATIGYSGFRARISFVQAKVTPLDVGNCSEIFTYPQGQINSTTISEEIWQKAHDFNVAVDCTWVVQAEKGKKIFLQFSSSDLTLEKPNQCSYNFIQIYKSQRQFEGLEGEPGKKCGSTINNIKSSDNVLAIRFYSLVHLKKDKRSNFFANYTVQRDSVVVPCHKEDEFDCKDGSCISKNQECNGLINCERPIDEEKCDTNQNTITADIFVIAFIGCVLIVGMFGGLVLKVYRKLRQDRQDLINKLNERG